MNLKSIKDRLKDEKLDLSLCELKEVPVREIAAVKKATHLDLSNNLLVSLPNTFVSLKQIVKLDLSRNMLTEIPENFGELKQLKYLDLYANQISRLPLSLSELKKLRWLDLKENPLTPAVASVAGPCSNLSECQACARNIVNYLSNVKLSIEEMRKSNSTAADTEKDTVQSKKEGKKKKKKTVEKDIKQSVDKNGSGPSNKMSKTEVQTSTSTQNHKQSAKKRASKVSGKARRSLLSSVAWLFLFSLAFMLMLLILPIYSKQSEVFMDYIENNTGIPLKALQEYSINTFLSSVRTTTTWTRDIYNNLYHIYEQNFIPNVNAPSE